MEILRRLVDGGIDVHTQIVLCPGWNDEVVMQRTYEDLLGLAPAGAGKGGIQNIRPVGGRDEDDPFIGLETVHFHQDLVKCLLTLVIAAAKASTTLPPYRINFVYKYNGRGALLRFFKEIAHAAGADANKHLHELRAGNMEERHPCFTCDSTGKSSTRS